MSSSSSSSKRLNLANKTLKIGFCNEMPFATVRLNESGYLHRMSAGFETAIIRELSNYFNFSMKMIDFQLQYGKKSDNGSWTGMIGAVQRNEVDLAIGGIMMSDERLKVVRYIHSYFLDQVTFVTLAPLPINNHSLDIFLHPFDWIVWLALASCFLLFFLADLANVVPSNERLLWASICSIFRQPYHRLKRNTGEKPGHAGARLMSLVWILASMILCTIYSASLCSLLAVPLQDYIDSVSKLSAACLAERVMIISHGNTSVFHNLLKLNDPVSRTLNRALLKETGWTKDTSVKEMVADALRSPKPYVMLTTRERLIYAHFRTGQSLFYVPYDDRRTAFFNTPLGMPVSVSFAHLVPFEELVIRMLDTGLVDFWRRREYQFRKVPETNPISMEIIQMEFDELATLFLLFLFGIAVSVIVAGTEIVFRRFKSSLRSIFCVKFRIVIIN